MYPTVIAITPSDLTSAAADLLSERGENPEYDKAIIELTAALLGLSTDYREAIEASLRTIKR